MATQSQIEANRQNARKSTGPRTQQGKDRARMNAIVHGLRATAVSDENDGPLRVSLREQLDAEWQPGSILESMVIDQIADTYLRLRRCPDVEAGMLGTKPVEKLVSDFRSYSPSKILKLHEYESRLARSLQRLIQQLRDLQRERFARDAEAADCVSDTPPADTSVDSAGDGAPQTPSEAVATPDQEIRQTNPIPPEAMNLADVTDSIETSGDVAASCDSRSTGVLARVQT